MPKLLFSQATTESALILKAIEGQTGPILEYEDDEGNRTPLIAADGSLSGASSTITGATSIDMEDPEAVGLTVNPAEGATENGTESLVLNDDQGDPTFRANADGSLHVAISGLGDELAISTDGVTVNTYLAHNAAASKLSFFGVVAQPQQVIPATPTVQDIADILVLHGFATQDS